MFPLKYLLTTLLISLAHTAQAAQALSLPPDVLKARIAEPHYTQETMPLAIPNGPTVTAKVLVPGPRKLSELDQKLPVALVFGGFEEADRVLDLLDPRVPVIVSSFDYPFKPPRRFEFPESFQHAPEAKRAIRQTIAGINELVAQLKKRRDVDAERITVVGASFGAPFALAAAAENPEISGVVLVHAFGDLPRAVEAILVRKWQNDLGFLARPLAWLVAHVSWLYLDAPSPETSAQKLAPTQHVLMVTPEADTMIPSECVESLWQAVNNSRAHRERVTTAGSHLEPGADKLIAEITRVVSDWMLKARLR